MCFEFELSENIFVLASWTGVNNEFFPPEMLVQHIIYYVIYTYYSKISIEISFKFSFGFYNIYLDFVRNG